MQGYGDTYDHNNTIVVLHLELKRIYLSLSNGVTNGSNPEVYTTLLRIPGKGKGMMLMVMQELMDKAVGASPEGLEEEVQAIHLLSSLDRHR